MSEYDYLEGKRLLIVDDEPDVLDSLEDLLSMCDVTKASNLARVSVVAKSTPSNKLSTCTCAHAHAGARAHTQTHDVTKHTAT